MTNPHNSAYTERLLNLANTAGEHLRRDPIEVLNEDWIEPRLAQPLPVRVDSHFPTPRREAAS